MNVFEGLKIKLESQGFGTHIGQMCNAAQQLSDYTNHPIIFTFNGVKLMADWRTTAVGLENEYYKLK